MSSDMSDQRHAKCLLTLVCAYAALCPIVHAEPCLKPPENHYWELHEVWELIRFEEEVCSCGPEVRVGNHLAKCCNFVVQGVPLELCSPVSDFSGTHVARELNDSMLMGNGANGGCWLSQTETRGDQKPGHTNHLEAMYLDQPSRIQYPPLSLLDLHPGDNVVDIGANLGIVSILLGKLFPGVHIVAYEPSQITAEFALHNIRANGLGSSVTLHAKAVTADGRRVHMQQSVSLAATNTIYQCAWITDKNKADKSCIRSNQLESVAASSVLADLPIPPRGRPLVKFLKIDCEGCEHEVLPLMPPDQIGRIAGDCHMELAPATSNLDAVKAQCLRFADDYFSWAQVAAHATPRTALTTVAALALGREWVEFSNGRGCRLSPPTMDEAFKWLMVAACQDHASGCMDAPSGASPYVASQLVEFAKRARVKAFWHIGELLRLLNRAQENAQTLSDSRDYFSAAAGNAKEFVNATAMDLQKAGKSEHWFSPDQLPTGVDIQIGDLLRDAEYKMKGCANCDNAESNANEEIVLGIFCHPFGPQPDRHWISLEDYEYYVFRRIRNGLSSRQFPAAFFFYDDEDHYVGRLTYYPWGSC